LTDDILGAQAGTGSSMMKFSRRKVRDPNERQYDYPGMLELTAKLKEFEQQ